jgi:ferredoxin-NADP reductase
VALLMLRRYRGVATLGQAGVLLPSLALTVMPWLFPDLRWIALGLGVHLLWFVACEKLLPKQPAPGPARRPGAAAGAHAAKLPPPAAPAPAGFHSVPVLAVFDESADIKTFRMLRPAGFDFAAGQFLTVKVHVDGKPLVRCYSISSCPSATGYLEISVKRQGVVSGMLHSTVRPGSMLAVKRPSGRFTYPAGDDRAIVFLAGGVGITPLISMFRHAIAIEPARPVTLVLSVRTEKDITFRRELEWLAERHPQARIAVAVSGGSLALVGGGSSRIERFGGRVNEALIRRLVPDLANSIFMICGPGPMMVGMRQLLAGLAVPPAQIRFEAFEAAVAMSKEGVATAHAVGSEADPAVTKNAAEGTATLTLRQTGVTVAVAPDQTLLDAAEAAGAPIPSSCRAGVCMTCRTRLLAGEVDCPSDSLDDEDRAAGYILPCVAWVKGSCALDA